MLNWIKKILTRFKRPHYPNVYKTDWPQSTMVGYICQECMPKGAGEFEFPISHGKECAICGKEPAENPRYFIIWPGGEIFPGINEPAKT